MSVENHELVITVDKFGVGRVSIVCGHSGDDRPCACHYDESWPDETTCRCINPLCPCRIGDHHECRELSGHVAEIGPLCRAMPADECWYEQELDNVAWEDLLAFMEPIELRTPVTLSGFSHEDPVEVRPAARPCSNCDGNGGFKEDTAILYGIPGGEDWGLMCDVCKGSGVEPKPSAEVYEALRRQLLERIWDGLDLPDEVKAALLADKGITP